MPRRPSRLVVRYLRRRRRGFGQLGYFGRAVGIAAVVGFLGGLAAVAFDLTTEFIGEHVTRHPLGLEGEGIATLTGRSVWILVIPAVGGVLVGWLTERYAREAEGHGTERLIHSFHRLSGVVRRRVIAVKALCSAITIGSGGSAGQEGPVAQVGSGIGLSLIHI